MAITFPQSPSTNDTHVVGNISYVWDGAKWAGGGITPIDRLIEDSNILEIENNNLLWTGSNVGFGTNNPGRILHVKSSGSSVVSDFECTSQFFTSIDLTNTGGYARITSLNNEILLSPAGSEKVRIDSNGNVGIGTNNPDRLLHLYDIDGPPLLIDRNSSGARYAAELRQSDTTDGN